MTEGAADKSTAWGRSTAGGGLEIAWCRGDDGERDCRMHRGAMQSCTASGPSDAAEDAAPRSLYHPEHRGLGGSSKVGRDGGGDFAVTQAVVWELQRRVSAGGVVLAGCSCLPSRVVKPRPVAVPDVVKVENVEVLLRAIRWCVRLGIVERAAG